jgi:hypothetical protein
MNSLFIEQKFKSLVISSSLNAASYSRIFFALRGDEKPDST